MIVSFALLANRKRRASHRLMRRSGSGKQNKEWPRLISDVRTQCALKRSSARKAGSTRNTGLTRRSPRLLATATMLRPPKRTSRRPNLQLEQSRIVAPFAGVVGRSSVRLAQEVKTSDVLFWITAETPLQVLFTVPETVMASFTVGKPLELTTSAFPDLRQVGRIVRVSPVVDPASGSIQVIGSVTHPSSSLKPGMSMQVRLAP